MTFHKFIGDSKMFEYDKYYRECQQMNKPFIKNKLNPRHGNYFVQIDMMPCSYNLSKLEQEEMKTMFENEMVFVNSNSKSKFYDFSIDKEIAWFDGISSEHIEDFCETLYDLVQKNH